MGQTQTKISDPARLSIPDHTFNERDTPPALKRLIQKKEIWQMKKKHIKSKLEILL